MSTARCRAVGPVNSYNNHYQACEAWIPAGGDYCPYCGHRPPHAVLGVDPGAPEAVVKAARRKLKVAHPDHGGSRSEFQRVKQARDRLLER